MIEPRPRCVMEAAGEDVWPGMMCVSGELAGELRRVVTKLVRAQDFLASANGCAPESLAYWVHQGALDSSQKGFLDEPTDVSL